MNNMKNSKRGLSTIVTTLIIILLVFIAVGIVWVVIQDVIQGGTETIDFQAQCLEISLEVTKVLCYPDLGGGDEICDITVKRNSGGEDFSGIKIIMGDANSDDEKVYEENTGINQLETHTFIGVGGWFHNVDRTSIEVTPYFLTPVGEKVIC